MTDDLQKMEAIQTALDRLANPAQVTPEVGERLRAVLAALDASDEADRALAGLLRGALTYPGSQPARDAAASLHAAIQTQQGRRAAGLKPRGRSKQYDPGKATLDTIPAGIAVRLALGQIERGQALVELQAYFGMEADERTIAAYLDAILPRVQGMAQALKSNN